MGDGLPEGTWAPHPASRRAWVLLALVLFSVLGQGERSEVDARFRTPDGTLQAYWSAMRSDDVTGAWECLAQGPSPLPYPGMVWFLPPTDEFRLANFEALPLRRDRMMVSYEVRYRPTGMGEELFFRTKTELVRVRGEWRIADPIQAESMPGWRPLRVPIGC